jgi:selenocysteine-specific elongation factor
MTDRNSPSGSRAETGRRPAQRSGSDANGDVGHRVVATAGHVDHGKSTLLQALTGMQPDRLAEEQRRGLTIELGFVWTTLPPTDDIRSNRRWRSSTSPGTNGSSPRCWPGPGRRRRPCSWSPRTTAGRPSRASTGTCSTCSGPCRCSGGHQGRCGRRRSRRRGGRRGGAGNRGDVAGSRPDRGHRRADGRGLDELRAVLRAGWPSCRRRSTWVGRGCGWTGASRSPGSARSSPAPSPTAISDRRQSARSSQPAGGCGSAGCRALGVGRRPGRPGTRVAANLAGVGHDQLARGDALVSVGRGAPPTWSTSGCGCCPGNGSTAPGHGGCTWGPPRSCQVRPLTGPSTGRARRGPAAARPPAAAGRRRPRRAA